MMISVVMPAYNASKFIAQAIESILKQTFHDFELIVVDDGSADNTIKIVNHYIKLDKRVRLIQNNHSGICQALNTGIQAAKYPWIARMDADDIALPERFEKQMKAANTYPNVVVWGSYVQHINSQGEILSLQAVGPLTEEESYSLIQKGDIPYVIHPTWIIKKEIFWQAGFYDPKFPLAQDVEIMSRIAHYGSIVVIPEPLLLYRVHSQSSSMKKFFAQLRMMEWAIARHKARLAGTQIPDFNQFIAQEKQQPIWLRLTRNITKFTRYCYRKAGLLVADKHHLQAVFYLGICLVCNPAYGISRLWAQKMSPTARRLMAN